MTAHDLSWQEAAKLKCNVNEVILDPEQRLEYIARNMRIEGMDPPSIIHCLDSYGSIVSGKRDTAKSENDDKSVEKLEKILRFLSGIRQRVDAGQPVEDSSSCYCGLPLTRVPKELRERVIMDHMIIKGAIEKAGITTYDPAEAPFNPQGELVGFPQDIFDVDNLMVLASRFFECTNIEASTGLGIEQRTAMFYNKIAINMVKKGITVTRMSTGARRVLVFEYHDAPEVESCVWEAVRVLKRFSPGVGVCSKHGNSLIGFEKGIEHPVCLHGLMEKTLPGFRYDFAGAYKRGK